MNGHYNVYGKVIEGVIPTLDVKLGKGVNVSLVKMKDDVVNENEEGNTLGNSKRDNIAKVRGDSVRAKSVPSLQIFPLSQSGKLLCKD